MVKQRWKAPRKESVHPFTVLFCTWQPEIMSTMLIEAVPLFTEIRCHPLSKRISLLILSK